MKKSLFSFAAKKPAKSKGFTLIEILVVIGIIAILAAIVIIAINPAKQFAQARNTQREAAVNSILNAVGQRIADNKGVFAGTFNAGVYKCGAIPAAATAISAANDDTVAGALGCLVPTYISDLPAEPVATSPAYTIEVNATGRVKVCAPGHAEAAIPDSATYCITR